MSFPPQQEQEQEPIFHPEVYAPMLEDEGAEQDGFNSLDHVENDAMRHHPSPRLHVPRDNITVSTDMNRVASDCTASATTNGSVCGESQRQQDQQAHVIIGGEMSRSDEEMIQQVLEEHKVLAQQSQGLEKLGAYVLPNDENAEPFDATSSIRTLQLEDEELSLHLSRPTGTGSQQLELWIREVNLAVSFKRTHPHHLSIETNDIMASGPQSRMALTPTKRHDLSPSKKNERAALSPTDITYNQRDYPHFSQDQFFSPTKKSLQDKRVIKSHQWPENYPASNEMQKSNLTSPAPSSTVHGSESSNLIMASIEGKYKSLRDDLIREPTFDEVASNNHDKDRESQVRGEEDEEINYSTSHRSKRSTSIRIPATPNLAAVPSRTPRIDFGVRVNNFSLGMLSTRSSGILQSNSYDSGSSFQSTLSGLSSYPEGRGCGLFLCD